MVHNALGRYLWGGMLALLALTGCEENIPADTLGGNYDLADYLYPKDSGTIVYQLFTSEKPKDQDRYSEETYQNDLQYDVIVDNKRIAITNRADADEKTDYIVKGDELAVYEHKGGITYHEKRMVSNTENFIRESVIRRTSEESGESTMTYECNATGHLERMAIDPNPKEYKDILHILCVRRNTIHADVGGKHFETVVETHEEKYAALDTGIIQSEETTCEYTSVDGSRQADDGCIKRIYKIWAFVPEQ